MTFGRKHRSSLTWREHHLTYNTVRTGSGRTDIPIMRKTPLARVKNWFSHHLAHGTACTLAILAAWLAADKSLGYTGMTIVPDLWSGADCAEMTPDAVARVFKEADMTMQVCGFLAGSKHNLQNSLGRQKALEALGWQFEFVKAAVRLGVGPNHMVGPLDIAWMSHKLQGGQKQGFTMKNYLVWLRALQRFACEKKTRLLIEFLNRNESPNPYPFGNLITGITDLDHLGIHWDTGHAAMLSLDSTDFGRALNHIGYFEAANWGRHPLEEEVASHPLIDFSGYFERLDDLSPECTFGVEPFDPDKVIKPFGLGDLCTTPWPGTECLEMDARFLQENGAMGPTLEV